jgi:transposase InsO family protein
MCTAARRSFITRIVASSTVNVLPGYPSPARIDLLHDGRGYGCYQNALAGRVNGILKGEFLLNRPDDLTQAAKMVAQSIRIYNQERPHTALKYKTPDVVHRASIAIKPVALF